MIRRMRRSVTLLGLIALVFALGALLAPWVYRGLQEAPGTWVREWAQEPFGRILSRTLLVLGLISLWPLVRLFGASFNSLGLSRPRAGDLIQGGLVGLVSLGVLVLIAHAAGARDLRPTVTAAKLANAIVLAAVAAVLVAPVEELLFRGLCFGMLRGQRWVPALIFSSVLFSFVHFLQTPRRASVAPVDWTTGFDTLAAMATAHAQPALAIAQAVNLALCGAILAVAYQRTGTLWWAIGLHAGWIFWLKLANAITLVPKGTAPWWGTRKVVDGWATTPILLATLAAVVLFTRPKSHIRDAPAPSRAPAELG